MKLYELPALYYGLHPAFQFLLILLFAFIGGELIRLQVYKRRTGDAWELRVMVREKLVDFIRTHYPESLRVHGPKYRKCQQARGQKAPGTVAFSENMLPNKCSFYL